MRKAMLKNALSMGFGSVLLVDAVCELAMCIGVGVSVLPLRCLVCSQCCHIVIHFSVQKCRAYENIIDKTIHKIGV